MIWDPKPYQEKAVSFALERKAAAIFPDMGLGKTSIMLECIRQEGWRALVVAPLHVARSGWFDECDKWDQFRSMSRKFLHGKNKAELLKTETQLTTINPEGLAWLCEHQLHKKVPYDALIIDESSLFKAYNTSRFKRLKPILSRFQRRYILSGTPAPEGAEDLWSQYYLLDEGKRLGRYVTAYRNRFFFSTGYGGYTRVLRKGAWEEIIGTVKDVTFRLDSKDYLQLPPMIENEVDVTLPADAIEVYKSFEKEFIANIGDDENKILADSSAAASMKCRQIASGAVWVDGVGLETKKAVYVHDAKLEAVETMVDSLQGQQCIIVYEFTPEVNSILDRVKKGNRTVGVCGGTVTRDESAKGLESFKRGETQVLIAHARSIGYGLNLQMCKHIIFFSLPWSLEAYTQLIARCQRQGQDQSVTVHYLLAKGTIDRRILYALREKEKEQKQLLGGLKHGE